MSYDVVQVFSPTAICRNGVCSAAPSQKLAPGSHTFYVIAYNAEGWGSWSTGRTYCIHGCAPFDSQFNSDANGWTTLAGSWTLGGGVYSTPGAGGRYATIAHTTPYAELDYQARIVTTGCAGAGCVTHLDVRGTPQPLLSSNDWNTGYLFGCSPGGLFAVFKWVGGSLTTLQSYTTTSAINTADGAANVLRVLTSGPTMVYYINDTPVWTGTDTSLTVGQVGVQAHTGSGSGRTISLDSARVTFPSPAAQNAARNVKISPEQQGLNDAASRRTDTPTNTLIGPALP